MQWAHFLVIAAVLLGIAIVLGTMFYGHQKAASFIYLKLVGAHWAPSTVQGSDPKFVTDANREILLKAAQDGARRSDSLRFEMTVWLVILLLVGAMMFGYHTFQTV